MMTVEVDDSAPAPVGSVKRRRRSVLLSGAALLFVGGVILWLVRAPIADNLVADQLRQRDVAATYRVEAIGPRTQRLANVVIGNPQRPDLTARSVELDLRWTWSGPVVAAIRADGVRLNARWVDGRLQMGEVDKLLPPQTSEAFVFPNLALTLRDARARIASPWGEFGARFDGEGPLRENFRGTVALVTGSFAAAGCTAGRASAFGEIRIIAGKPRFAGPVRARDVACAEPKLSLAKASIGVEAEVSADFARWTGQIDGVGSGVAADEARLAEVSVNGDFSGTRTFTTFDFNASGKQFQLAGMAARTIVGSGTVAIGAAQPSLTAQVRVAGASLSKQQERSLTAIDGGADDALFGPLRSKIGAALRQATDDFGGEAELALVGNARTQRLEVIAPTLRSASGAVLRAEPTSRIAILLGGKRLMALVDGRWTLSGGGLPSARLDIVRSESGSVRGNLVLEPLVAGSTRLAIAPVAISGDRTGRLRLLTRAMVSGAIGGGRVDGLGIAIDAMVSPTGAVQLANGCQVVSLNSAALSGVRLGSNRVRLCSAGGRPLLAYDRRQLTGELLFPAPVLAGLSGTSPLRVSAAQGRYSMASGQWLVDTLDVQLDAGDAVTRFLATSVTGVSNGASMNGRIEGGSGSIGAVPLDVSEITGDWRWFDNQLTVNAGLIVNDKAAERRFNTLISKDAVMTFADGKIDASASFAERETGTAIGRAELRHMIENAAGSADVIIAAMRFNNQFQPDQLTPLALGVIANTQGTMAGRGRVDWADGKVTSSGTFTTAGSDFAAAFGSVKGASSTIVFDDLLAVHTPPGQKISFDEINPGFPVIGGMINYQMIDSTNIRIEGGRWPFAGGELLLRPTTLDFDVNAVRKLEFELKGVDAAIFLAELGFDNINASGVFDGVLPVEFSGLGGRIVGGRLVARPGGGEVAYVGELTNYNLGTMANFAFNMLKSLRYEAMIISLNGDLDGEMLTDMKITGLSQGKGASRNLITRQLEKLPIEFNVRIDAPFRQLITSAKSLYDPSVFGAESLYQLIEARRAAGGQPVQPAASESVP